MISPVNIGFFFLLKAAIYDIVLIEIQKYQHITMIGKTPANLIGIATVSQQNIENYIGGPRTKHTRTGRTGHTVEKMVSA